MQFLELTSWLSRGGEMVEAPISINPRAISSISPRSDGAMICMMFAEAEYPIRHYVIQSYDVVMNTLRDLDA